MKDREIIMSYIGLTLPIVVFILISWERWGKSLGDNVAIIAMFAVIAYFILCSIAIGLRAKNRTKFIQYMARLAMQTAFGYLALFLGLVSLGIFVMQYGYPFAVLVGELIILAAYVVLIWGIRKQAVTIHRKR
jgi:hypothetical protein